MKTNVFTIMAVLAVSLAYSTDVMATVNIEWVTVGDAGNAVDTEVMDDSTTDYGSVDYAYRIGKYEVTNEQYTEFLNAVADVCDPYNLYNTDMNDTIYGGIKRTGSLGSYTYDPKDGDPNKPVNYVSWYDALRFANWLHNAQPPGLQNDSTTEDGAYDMDGDPNLRKPGAKVWLTSEDEWYKAAYYKGGGTNAGYWDYATQSDTIPTMEAPPGTDDVNGSANYDFVVESPTEVGAYTAKPSESAYSTYDQAGNVWEWNESLVETTYPGYRGVRGGSWYIADAHGLPAYNRRSYDPLGSYLIGFRVVSVGMAVLSPNGGEELIAGNNYSIRWESASDINNVTIEYSTNNGADYNDVNTVPNTGSYEWLVPEVTSPNCLVRISDANDPNIYDTSDDVFTIFQCLGPIPGDLDNDCYVDFRDFAIVAQHWLHTGNPLDSASGIVAYWSFNDTGDPGHDDSGNGHNGTINGGVTSIDGVSGKALDFDGVDGYVDFGGTIGDFGTSDFSIVLWLRTNTDRDETVIGKREFCGEHSFWELNMSEGPAQPGRMLVELYEGFPSIHGSFPGNQRVDDNQWHLLAITRQGVEAKLYIDGFLDASRSAAKVIDMSNSAPFLMGRGPCIPANADYFSGELDEVLIYNRALTGTEIQYLYKNP